jgi:hypothetical protein
LTTSTKGWRTSEFWVTVLTIVAPVAAAAFHIDIRPYVGDWAEAITGVIGIVYVIGRTSLKKKTVTEVGIPVVFESPDATVNDTLTGVQ